MFFVISKLEMFAYDWHIKAGIDIHRAEELLCELLTCLLLHDVQVLTSLRLLSEVDILVSMLTKSIHTQPKYRYREISLTLKSFGVLHREVFNCVAVTSNQADYPFVGSDEEPVVDLGVLVFNHILPRKGLFKCLF